MFGFGKDAATWYREGNNALRNNEDRKAIECYRKAISKAPTPHAAWPAYSNMGAAYSALKQYSEALDCFDRALQFNPNDPPTLGNRAIARKEMGDLQGALDDETLAIAYDSNNSNHYLNRAQTNRRLGEYRSAIVDSTKALACPSPGGWHKARIFSNRGIARYCLQEWKSALDDFNRAIEAAPDSSYYYRLWRGAVYFKTGNVDGALQDYIYACRNQRGNLAGPLQGILPLLEQKRYREAAEALRGVVSEDDCLIPLAEYLASSATQQQR